MATALKKVAQICFPVIKVTTTNHKTPRATYLRPEFHPGGVDLLSVGVIVTWTESFDDIIEFLGCVG